MQLPFFLLLFLYYFLFFFNFVGQDVDQSFTCTRHALCLWSYTPAPLGGAFRESFPYVNELVCSCQLDTELDIAGKRES